MLFGLFGCSGARAVVYRPDPKAETTRCAVVEVTDVHMGKPVSPSIVKPDSWLEGKVVDRDGVDDDTLRVDFESLTQLAPQVGQTWVVRLDAKGNAVQLSQAESGATCD